MAIYRCANCGSAKVEYDDKKNVYICSDCESSLRHPMPDDIKTVIDLCLINKDFRTSSTLQKYNISWSYLCRAYKNIEEGIADRLSAMQEAFDKESLLSYAKATEEEFEEAIETIKSFKDWQKIYTADNPMSLLDYYTWQNAVEIFIENAAKYYDRNTQYQSFTRGIDKKKLAELFVMYLFEKMRVEGGNYLVFEQTGDYEEVSEDLELYAKDVPFLLLFANRYFKLWTMEAFTHIERECPWTAEMFGRIFSRYQDKESMASESIRGEFGQLERAVSHGGGLVQKKWIIGLWIKELDIVLRMPRYIVENGKLYYSQYSFFTKSYHTVSDLTEFFKAYPEKKQLFDSRMAEITKLKEKLAANEKEKGNLRNKMESNEELLYSAEAEVAKLSKKLFGKQKAKSRIEELNEEIQKLKNENDKISTRVKEIEADNIMGAIRDKTYSLAISMNCFLILSPCEA